MWTALVIFVLLCGYKYIDCHIPSKIELQKAQGWNAYFQVGLKGAEFLIGGIILALSVYAALYLLMFIFNVPAYLGASYDKFTFASDLQEFRFATISFLSWLVVIFTTLISLGQASTARNNSENPEKRIDEIRKISEKNSIRSVLWEAWDSGLLVLVTLKSRKVYVGMVDEARFLNFHTNADSTITLIPFMSGYRDKDSLSFKVEHRYVDFYVENNINLDSEPLSVYQFRHVLPIEQIESFSLFNVDTYESFQQKSITAP